MVGAIPCGQYRLHMCKEEKGGGNNGRVEGASAPQAGAMNCAPPPISPAFPSFSRHSRYLSGIVPCGRLFAPT